MFVTLKGLPDIYQIPLAISAGAALEEIAAIEPDSIVARFNSAAGPIILHDALVREDFHQGLLGLIAANATLPVLHEGRVTPESNAALDAAFDAGSDRAAAIAPAPLDAQPGEAVTLHTDALGNPSAGDRRGEWLQARASTKFTPGVAAQLMPSRLASAEQSNTAILFGRQLFLKLYRRLQPERNPEVEVGRFLTEVAHFPGIPAFLGEISMSTGGAEEPTVAMLEELVDNDGDGWQWFLGRLTPWLTLIASLPAPAPTPAPGWLSDPAPVPESLLPVQPTLDAAALLGKRTAELHLALASDSRLPSFAPEPLTREHLEREAAAH